MTCTCHSDASLYGRLVGCPRCRHQSYDAGVGCERRACAYDGPVFAQQALNIGDAGAHDATTTDEAKN